VVKELKACLAETSVFPKLRLAVELLETGRQVPGVAALARVDTLTVKLKSAVSDQSEEREYKVRIRRQRKTEGSLLAPLSPSWLSVTRSRVVPARGARHHRPMRQSLPVLVRQLSARSPVPLPTRCGSRKPRRRVSSRILSEYIQPVPCHSA